ncbi:hypothetical protein A0H81_12739 [Grifola frondosa]|uniref:Uncharacterized protein n=1 Tax=Grifola frondosa TaxID=5627 RepID=A0A1C7LRQ3_GRIFR|nr:hypothetical protein A0H81_12739 [Grifola frondosa]
MFPFAQSDTAVPSHIKTTVTASQAHTAGFNTSMPPRTAARHSKKRRVEPVPEQTLTHHKEQGVTREITVTDMGDVNVNNRAFSATITTPEGSATIGTPSSTQGPVNVKQDEDVMPALIPLEVGDDYDVDYDDDDPPPPLEPADDDCLDPATNSSPSLQAVDEGPPCLDHADDGPPSLEVADDGPLPLEPAHNSAAPLDSTEIINPGYLPDTFVEYVYTTDVVIDMLTFQNSRLTAFVELNDVGSARFSIAHIPATATWGIPTARDNALSKILCYEDKPMLIWLVGQVKSLWFYTFGGDPQEKVNIALTPLRDVDIAATRNLINLHANPPGSMVFDPIYVSKYMMSRSKNKTIRTPAPFTRVYDATKQYSPKSTMKQISAAALDEHDVVLVECFLTRWQTDDKATRTKRWVEWCCGLELNTVSLLFSAPDTSKDLRLNLDDEIAFM